jgi:molybdate transport system regulatory protein
MKISARNVLAGTVKKVTKGLINAEIALELEGGESVVAIISNSSVDSLDLREGKSAYAIIKASDVLLGKDVEGAKLSARNVLAGDVASLHDGIVSSEVEIRLAGGSTVVASITKASVKALDLHQGDKVSAIVKASHVMLGV